MRDSTQSIFSPFWYALHVKQLTSYLRNKERQSCETKFQSRLEYERQYSVHFFTLLLRTPY